ncbi:MAG: sensor histidine kinase [Eubacterium sp.]|nr:sensor histidine kinase [Eubacterium sp.]
MNFKSYLKDKIVELITASAVLVITIWLLVAFKVNPVLILLLAGLFVMSLLGIFIYDYNRKKKFFNDIKEKVSRLDKAYLVLETLDTPDFLEGRLIVDTLYEIDKSMAENVALYQKQSRDFSEYIEMWLHEVKLPLSAISLKIHNLLLSEEDQNKNAEFRKLLAQTRRIESLVNQVLYYVRSENVEKDYHISKVSVADIVHDTAMTYRENLQDNDMDYLVETGALNIEKIKVNTDQKWLIFIMGQLISNSIKYKKDEGEAYVRIVVSEAEGKVNISLEDNGIGIPEEDLKRVFDKSFTGQNGLDRTKSTGMGLYIVKELCRKLGHEISIESEQGKWTRVDLSFSDNEFYDVV